MNSNVPSNASPENTSNSATRRGFLAASMALGAGLFFPLPAMAKDTGKVEAPSAAPATEVTPVVAPPQRVMLSVTGDAAHGQSVAWRATQTLAAPQGQIAPLSADPASVKQAQTVAAQAIAPEATQGLEARHYALTFTGLEPGAKYCYRVGDGATWSEWNIFQTAAVEAKPFRFLYVGDVQNDIRSMCSRMVRAAYQQVPDARFILCAGDLVTEGCNDALWSEFADAFSVTEAMVPLLPTPGNHDTHHATEEEEKARPYGAAVQYHAHFHLPENGPKDAPDLRQEAYYYDFQGVRVISVNSNVYAEEKPRTEQHQRAWDGQLAWLEEILANNPNRWTIATHHHPLYSMGKNRDNRVLRELLRPLYEKYKVDLVLQGHDHSYGRTHKLAGDKIVAPDAPGVIYVVSMSGPKMYESKPKFADLMARTDRNQQLFQTIAIDGDTLTYHSHAIDGRQVDGFQLKKDGAGASTYVNLQG